MPSALVIAAVESLETGTIIHVEDEWTPRMRALLAAGYLKEIPATVVEPVDDAVSPVASKGRVRKE